MLILYPENSSWKNGWFHRTFLFEHGKTALQGWRIRRFLSNIARFKVSEAYENPPEPQTDVAQNREMKKRISKMNTKMNTKMKI